MDLLSAMRVFVRVADRGSMSQAARDLGTVQSSISERIDRLERFLGIRLLHRTSRAMTCTEEGWEFYAHCKIVIAAADEACAAIDLKKRTLSGSIRVACPQCFGDIVFPRILAKIVAHHPSLKIDLTLNDRVVDPVTEGVDLSFRLGPNLGENLIATRIGYIQRSLVASPAYLSSNAPINSPDELAVHPFIHVKGIFANGKITLKDSQDNSVQAAISPRIVTSHWHPMYKLLLSGNGIGVVQTPACAGALRDGRLVELLPAHRVPPFELTALVPASRPILPKVRETISLAKKYISEIDGFSLLP